MAPDPLTPGVEYEITITGGGDTRTGTIVLSEPEATAPEEVIVAPVVPTPAPVETPDPPEPTGPAPLIESPEPGAVLDASAAIRWRDPDEEVIQWWVRAGTPEDDSAYFNSGRITDASQRGVQMSGLPSDGSDVVVVLGAKLAAGSWIAEKTTHATARQAPSATIVTPPQGSGEHAWLMPKIDKWGEIIAPPDMTGATVYRGPKSLSNGNWPGIAKNGIPGGPIYRIRANKGERIIVDMRGEVVDRPLSIEGDAQHVVLRGGRYCPRVSSNGKPGRQPQDPNGRAKDARGRQIMNQHPRPAALWAIRVECWERVWCEGAFGDLVDHELDTPLGLDADFLVPRLGKSQTPRQGYETARVSMVNCRARGIEGNHYGYHGDFVQNQGSEGESHYRLDVINCAVHSSYNGITWHTWDSRLPTRRVFVHGYYFDLDPDYASDQATPSGYDKNERADHVGGLALTSSPPNLDCYDVSGLLFRCSTAGNVAIRDNNWIRSDGSRGHRGSGTQTRMRAHRDIDGRVVSTENSRHIKTIEGATLIPGDRSSYREVWPYEQLLAEGYDPAPEAAVGEAYVSPYGGVEG